MKYFKSFMPAFLKAAFIAIVAVSAMTSISLAATHGEHRVDADSRLSGNSLEHELWGFVQSKNEHGLTELISPFFLGGNLQSNRNYETFLAILKNLSITEFSISNVVESQDEDIRIISYDLVAQGSIPILDHRISVWQRKKHKHHQFFWQLISHSSFSLSP